jgi:hypothetical protein
MSCNKLKVGFLGGTSKVKFAPVFRVYFSFFAEATVLSSSYEYGVGRIVIETLSFSFEKFKIAKIRNKS